MDKKIDYPKKISQMCEYWGLTLHSLAIEVDASYSSFVDYKRGRSEPKPSLYRKIKSRFPDFSSDWWFLDIGEIEKRSNALPEELQKMQKEIDTLKEENGSLKTRLLGAYESIKDSADKNIVRLEIFVKNYESGQPQEVIIVPPTQQ